MAGMRPSLGTAIAQHNAHGVASYDKVKDKVADKDL